MDNKLHRTAYGHPGLEAQKSCKDDPLYQVYRNHLRPRDDEDLFRIDDWLLRMAYGHPGYELFDRPKDTAALDRLDRAISEIATIFAEGSLSESAEELIGQALLGLRSRPDVQWDDDTKYGPLPDMSAIDALHFLDERHVELRKAIASTRRKIEESENSRRTLSNLNLQGVKIVAVARDIWRSEIGRDAPRKDLNPASSFGLFLQDLLDALEVPGDARSVFRAWRREHDKASPSHAE